MMYKEVCEELNRLAYRAEKTPEKQGISRDERRSQRRVPSHYTTNAIVEHPDQDLNLDRPG